MMAEWATIEHQTGVEPPPLPPPINIAEIVKEAVQDASGVSRAEVTAFAIDSSPVTPALQLRARVSRGLPPMIALWLSRHSRGEGSAHPQT